MSKNNNFKLQNNIFNSKFKKFFIVTTIIYLLQTPIIKAMINTNKIIQNKKIPVLLLTTLEQKKLFEKLYSCVNNYTQEKESTFLSEIKDLNLHENFVTTSDSWVFTKEDIDQDLKKGSSILHFACKYNLKTIVDYQLYKNSDTNIQNDNGDTPLHLALRNENIKLDIIKKLLDYKAKLNIKNNLGECPNFQIKTCCEIINSQNFATKENKKLFRKLYPNIEKACAYAEKFYSLSLISSKKALKFADLKINTKN